MGAMTVEQTRATLEAYLEALLASGDFGRYFADDLVVVMVEAGQETRGREAAVGLITAAHREAFAARIEPGQVVVGAGTAALEATFVGTHTGEFAGIPATGRQVRVPYAVFYELADERITALRIYGLAGGLVRQLSTDPAAP